MEIDIELNLIRVPWLFWRYTFTIDRTHPGGTLTRIPSTPTGGAGVVYTGVLMGSTPYSMFTRRQEEVCSPPPALYMWGTMYLGTCAVYSKLALGLISA